MAGFVSVFPQVLKKNRFQILSNSKPTKAWYVLQSWTSPPPSCCPGKGDGCFIHHKASVREACRSVKALRTCSTQESASQSNQGREGWVSKLHYLLSMARFRCKHFPWVNGWPINKSGKDHLQNLYKCFLELDSRGPISFGQKECRTGLSQRRGGERRCWRWLQRKSASTLMEPSWGYPKESSRNHIKVFSFLRRISCQNLPRSEKAYNRLYQAWLERMRTF